MGSISATISTAAGVFAGTNVDDMIVLAVLNASARTDGRPRPWQICVGQFAGVAVLVCVSMLVAAGMALAPERWIWLLGLVPLVLGVRKLLAAFRASRAGEQISPVVVHGLPGVVGLTIANGGDNVATYAPVFATTDAGDTVVTLAVFTVGVALWCLLGAGLVAHRKVTEAVSRWGHWTVPAVFILIGLYVFHKTGALGF
ncbi:cadmium resistance transporter [Saccharopolyspora rosea]|uniref:Cadmium resistance transporter n=1 Tax=Saccharopolyspora rosea TaxID=524884 RepID=A0ABW3FZN2_9PSEU|nr:cadmium resistance transporter [Saccharopolyspora rosea]